MAEHSPYAVVRNLKGDQEGFGRLHNVDLIHGCDVQDVLIPRNTWMCGKVLKTV
jgi:hypothetical protein